MVLGGICLVVVGALIWLLGARGGGGALPGDIVVGRGNFTFMFPIVTCIILSVVLTILFRLFHK